MRAQAAWASISATLPSSHMQISAATAIYYGYGHGNGLYGVMCREYCFLVDMARYCNGLYGVMSREYCILVCDELLTSMCAKVFVSRRWPTGASQGVSPTTTTAETTFLSSREHFKMEYHSYLWHRLCSPLVIMLERRSCNHCAVCQWARLYCFIFSRDMPEGLSQRHMPEGLSQRQDATGYVCSRARLEWSHRGVMPLCPRLCT